MMKNEPITEAEMDDHPEDSDHLGDPEGPRKQDEDDFLIVGIGASAGGIGATKAFFEHVKEETHAAYVVILHLSPDHESQLAHILQATSPIPVTQVTEPVTVEPGQVYVVPPNKGLRMSDGKIILVPVATVEERRAPIDIFFRTLAESHRDRAVAVVLSGTGADGSMGLKRVKENGGVAFVQSPDEAEFNAMPRNAVATNLVDAVVGVTEIPGKIELYLQGLKKVQTPDRGDQTEQQKAIRDVFIHMRSRTGHDFTNYKRATMLRRIERRINVRGLSGVTEYAAYLREFPDEPIALLKDLLISVTNFFRDRKAWDHIERDIVPRILESKTPGEPVRIWTAGCATGEEAYSMAMLFAERTFEMAERTPVQIFATDIDAHAIATAREGRYSMIDAADVSPDRLRRFFIQDGETYRVRPEIREMILFAGHNLLKDPPFSNLDLVSCRNVLIYLNGAAQERVMETMHFALKPGGYFFLGSSESADKAHDLFAAVSKTHHLYESRHLASRMYPIPESVPSYSFETKTSRATNPHSQRAAERMTYGELHHQLLERYASPSVVVNEDYEIVHASERAGKYLQVVGGEPLNNLLRMVHPDLRLELRTTLFQAVQRAINVESRGLKVVVEGQTETVNIHVRPVLESTDTARGFLLVLFEQAEEVAEKAEAVYTSPDPLARQLEQELVRSRAQLRSSLEQAEIQTEELRASNEELQAMNEELHSAAKELETSKEELQSMNEELATTNQELKVKIDELSQSNNNFQNLINSIDIATLFLDRGFRINLFSPAASSIFNLLPSDIGRPLTDITGRLKYNGMVEDASKVMETLQTLEHEVLSQDDSVYLMRVLPYRTSDDLIKGVVMTFIDITERKVAEQTLLQRSEETTRFNDAMIGREARMIALKKEVNDLAERAKIPKPYPLDFEDQP